MLNQGEIVAIVDEKNNVVGAAPRFEMRAKNLPHRAAYILVFNSSGELFVQKRTPVKDVYPGYYDVAAGGVVLADESYEISAERELAEEMGIRDVALTHLFDFYHQDADSRVWGRVYSCVYDGEIVLEEDEVESGGFYSVDEVLQSSLREPYTPDGLSVLKRYLKEKLPRH
jgi:8-oxo-dGTP pyrophosphatase MutT (NUDIX family)